MNHDNTMNPPCLAQYADRAVARLCTSRRRRAAIREELLRARDNLSRIAAEEGLLANFRTALRERGQAADAQALLSRVEIRPDDAFTAKYPHELSTRITIKTKDGRAFDREQVGYEGGLGNPLSWERAVEKFNWLSEPFADAELRHNIVDAVLKIDERPISDLMGLLGKVNPKAVYPGFHPGIQ